MVPMPRPSRTSAPTAPEKIDEEAFVVLNRSITGYGDRDRLAEHPGGEDEGTGGGLVVAPGGSGIVLGREADAHFNL